MTLEKCTYWSFVTGGLREPPECHGTAIAVALRISACKLAFPAYTLPFFLSKYHEIQLLSLIFLKLKLQSYSRLALVKSGRCQTLSKSFIYEFSLNEIFKNGDKYIIIQFYDENMQKFGQSEADLLGRGRGRSRLDSL